MADPVTALRELVEALDVTNAALADAFRADAGEQENRAYSEAMDRQLDAQDRARSTLEALEGGGGRGLFHPSRCQTCGSGNPAAFFAAPKTLSDDERIPMCPDPFHHPQENPQ